MEAIEQQDILYIASVCITLTIGHRLVAYHRRARVKSFALTSLLSANHHHHHCNASVSRSQQAGKRLEKISVLSGICGTYCVLNARPEAFAVLHHSAAEGYHRFWSQRGRLQCIRYYLRLVYHAQYLVGSAVKIVASRITLRIQQNQSTEFAQTTKIDSALSDCIAYPM